MSVETMPPAALSQASSSLLGSYLRFTLWYLLIVGVAWAVGLEGIHGHPFPFYALLAPVFTSPLGPMLALGVLAAAFVIVQAVRRQSLAWPAVAALVSFGGALFFYRNMGNADAATTELSSALWLMVAAVLLAAFLAYALRFCMTKNLDDLSRPDRRRFLLVVVVFAAIFPAAVAMIRGGPEALAQAYNRSAYEYINDIGLGGSIRGLFAKYAEMHPYLSMHSKVHPPGPATILWVFSFVAGRTPMGLSIATILFGSLSVLPMYAWSRDVLGGRAAAIATVLYALVPTIVLFTATSADITFMPFTITTLFLFWRAVHRPSILCAVGAGILYGVLGLISFSLVGIGAFFGFVGLWRIVDPRHRRGVMQTAVVMLAFTVGVQVLVWWWSGYHAIEVFHLSKAQFDTDQFNLDALDPRLPAWAWRFANPLCWAFFAGLPVSLLAWWRLRTVESDARGLVYVFSLALLALDILYLARGEGERSAMYIVPFLVVLAAHMLSELVTATQSWQPVLVTAAFLGVQTIAIESALYTYW